MRSVFVNSPPPKPEVILTNFFTEPTVLLVPITSRDNLISFQLKGYVPKFKKKNILYRSFKDFNHEIFLNDLQSVNFENQIADDDDVNRAYSKFETSFIEIIDKHIPIKKRKSVAYPVPYMNQNLRNGIYKKKMYHNKFLKQKTDKN